MMAAIFSLTLATLVYLAAFEIFGPIAALFALALVVFEPNLIAHGAYVTTDMAVTFGIFATVYALYRFRVRHLPSAGLRCRLARQPEWPWRPSTRPPCCSRSSSCCWPLNSCGHIQRKRNALTSFASMVRHLPQPSSWGCRSSGLPTISAFLRTQMQPCNPASATI